MTRTDCQIGHEFRGFRRTEEIVNCGKISAWRGVGSLRSNKSEISLSRESRVEGRYWLASWSRAPPCKLQSFAQGLLRPCQGIPWEIPGSSSNFPASGVSCGLAGVIRTRAKTAKRPRRIEHLVRNGIYNTSAAGTLLPNCCSSCSALRPHPVSGLRRLC